MKKTPLERSIPIYLRIENHLKSLIMNGSGRTEPLPFEPDLALQFGVSRMTVRQAYQRLVLAGLVVRRKRAGSFATGHIVEELPIEGAPNFASWVIRGEAGSKREVLEFSLVTAPAEVSKSFGLRRGEKVTYVSMRRYRAGVPCLDFRYLPAKFHDLLSRDQIERAGLLQSMSVFGHEIHSGHVEADAHLASDEDVRMLQLKRGDPVLERRLRFNDLEGNCLLLGHSRYPSGAAYTFRVEFHEVASPPTRTARNGRTRQS